MIYVCLSLGVNKYVVQIMQAYKYDWIRLFIIIQEIDAEQIGNMYFWWIIKTYWIYIKLYYSDKIKNSWYMSKTYSDLLGVYRVWLSREHKQM